MSSDMGVVERGRFYFWAGRITNPPWGAPLRSRIRNLAGFAMSAPILKRTCDASHLPASAICAMLMSALIYVFESG